jgi:energy-coupling factor transporter ATP-binding protein EcfA2
MIGCCLLSLLESIVMNLDLPQFYRVCNPSTTFDMSAAEERKYYIDFSSVRSRNIIDELQANITLFSPEEATCQLFTGHIGCGKTTELLCLKSILEDEGFQVVYMESSQSLNLADTDIGEILLTIASHLSQSFEVLELTSSTLLWQSLLQELWKILNREVESQPLALVSVMEKNGISSLNSELRTITLHAKKCPELRLKLRQYLEPRISLILKAINTELIEPATVALKQLGKKGLVTIVDNLDRLEAVQKPWGRSQPEYLFVDRGEQLCKLNCHMVYTIPLSLIFSKDFGRLSQRFGCDPKILPAIPVRDRHGRDFEPGIGQLQQMILARAFPDVATEDRQSLIPQVFADRQTLDRLCYMSGGHARNLLRLLHRWIEKDRQFPLSRKGLEVAIRERRQQLVLSLSGEEKDLLCQVAKRKRILGTENYQFLIRHLLVFEYQDDEGSWFDINPMLSESQEFAV